MVREVSGDQLNASQTLLEKIKLCAQKWKDKQFVCKGRGVGE